MRKSDKQYGVPFAEYSDTKANIEAIAAPVIGMSAYATDNPTAPVGTYNGTSWDWQPLTGGGGITDAPADGVYYGRRNNVWTNLKTYFDTLYAAITHNHSGTYEPANANIQSHIANTSNPHAVTAAQVGAGAYTNKTSFTPYIYGTTSAGVGTYTTQDGQYAVVGNIVFISILLVWTAHTGTGDMRVGGLPFIAFNAAVPYNLAVTWSNITLLAVGNKLEAYILASTASIVFQEVGSGSNSTVPMDTAGTIRVTGFYFK